MRIKLLSFLTISLTVVSTQLFAQLNVNNGFNAQQLGNNLAGNNVNVFNASISGDPEQYGLFQYTGNDLGLNSGVILSTGNIFDAVGPNNDNGTSTGYNGPGDADLSGLAGFNTNDAVVFEFDFEVLGDEIEFNFVFMSEEYNEWVNSGFNDVFAFYISGPGIVGQENLAVIPGTTTPVTINSINNGSFWQFYNDNTGGAVNIEFDGFTTLMTAQKSGLTPCQVYTLSLRIADGSDDALDSGVLLQENSLVQSNISASSATFSANNTALEGCIDASFTFQLDSILPYDVTIPIGIGGSATNGVDYAQIDSLITIPAGQTSATIIIDAIAEGITEGQEVVELYFTPAPCEPEDTVFLYIDDYIPLEYNITPTDITCAGAADGQVDLSVSGGIAPYYLTLTDSLTGDVATYNSFPVVGLDAGTYYVEVIDGYGCTAEDIIAGNLFDAGQTFIPDGQGQSWSSVINLSGFSGATVQTPDQIQSVCATLEHSKIGELEITLTSPSGTVVVLKEQPGGNNTNFGEPCAVGPTDAGGGGGGTDPGIGYNYCWQNISTFGTMVAESGNYTYTYINPCDGSSQSDKYLPAGSYQPYESFGNFVGDQLDGDWMITVTDNIPNNNGYIFDWSISLQADPPDSIFTIYEPAGPTFTSTTVQPDCGVTNGSIDLTVSGGEAPFTFLWNTGATTEDLSNIAAGTYTVDVTDNSNCVHTYQVNLSNTGSLTITGVVSNESCADANDGSIDITVNGTPTFTYTWSNGASTEDISNLAPGTYTVEVQDGGNCEGVESFTITSAPNINITATITNEVCGDGEGIIDLSLVGAIAPITYLWSNGEITQDINELNQGEYIVELTDNNGCYVTDTFTVNNLVGNCVPNCDLAITNEVVTNETCGSGNGAINLTLFTTNGPISVSWDNGSSTEDLNNLSAGVYTVTLTDMEGCEIVQDYTLTNQTGNLAITSINATNENCGNNQGAADASVTGGSQPYSYLWSNGATSQDLTGVSAGTYTLTVTDDNGCSTSQTVTINNITNGLTQTYGNAVNEVCGNGVGSIDIQISGGQTPYSYSWSNGATTQDLTGLSAGTYTCTITDANGCSITTPDYVIQNLSGSLVMNNIDIDNEVCSNTLGDIELFYSGGTAPITVSWSTGDTGNQLSNLTAGTYSATVTDANGCSLTTGNLIVLNESGTLQIVSVTAFDELCGNGTGSINVETSGGTAPLSYDWNNGSTSQDISNLSAGDYSCVITDINGCTVYASENIMNDPGVLNIDNIIITDENCGQYDGALNVIISGAAAPMTYLWNTGDNTEDLSNIPAGSYTIEVTDNNGCSTTGSAVVNNLANGLELVDVAIVNEICTNGLGSIDISVTGGTAPLTFSWDNGSNSEDINGLSAGTYTCTVTDNTGCSIVAGPYSINNSSGGLQANITALSDENCSGSNGSIDVTTTGGTAPYTYSWNTGQNTEDISGLSAGSYVLTVTGANGCQTSIMAEIINDAGTLEIIDVTITDENCTGANGAIDITVSGGTPGYTFLWSNTSITEDLSGLSAGIYSVDVTDINGCTLNSGDIIVNNNSGNFQVTGINVVNEECGNGLGNVDLIVSGATGSVLYTWSNGATSQDLNGVSAGSYSGTATDVSGCIVTFSATVENDPGIMSVSDVITDAFCDGGNGSIDITVNDATAPFTFVWSNGSTNEDISSLNAGSYTCNISDAAGCMLTYTGVINDLGGPEITSVTLSDENCGAGDGSILLNITGGTQPYTYSWTGQAPNPCCTYTLDMQDQGNSWNGASIDVFVDGVFTGNYTVPGGGANVETFDVCNGNTIELYWNPGGFDNEVSFDLLDATGAIVFAQGGNPSTGLIYTGSATCAGGVLDGNYVEGLSAGTYSVVVTDANGCEDSVTVNLENTSGNLQITNAIVSNETCSDDNGSIDLTVTGTGQITYSWSNGETTQDLTDLQAGTYTISLSDAIGCINDATYTLTNITNGLALTSFSLNDENCGDGTGSIDITMTGGAGPLSYEWSNGFTAEDISGLNAGSYTVTVFDGTVCNYDTTFIIGNNSGSLSASTVITDATCGQNNGSIDLSVSGNSSPFVTLWSTGDVTEDLSNLAPGSYTCDIIEDSGCSVSVTVNIINDGGSISLSATTNPDDCEDGVGDVNLTATGGTAPLTYSWNNGASTEDLTNVNSGNYTVIVTDANGCTATDTYNVASEGNFNYTSTIVDDNCGNGNGSINITISGFPNPQTYDWSNGATTQDISGLTSGWYIVEMANTFGPGGGCTMIDSFYVANVQGTINIDSLVVTNETCNFNDGAINAYISGGNAPYTYQWSNGEITEDISGLDGGDYTLSVTDANGCMISASETINSYTFGMGITSAIITDESCGDGSGAIDITVVGGASPYSFDWDTDGTGDFDDSEDQSGLNAGSYTLTIMDAGGCEVSNTFDVGNYTGGLNVQIVVTDETCGNSNGAIDLTVNGGIAPITFTWSIGDNTEDLSNLQGGNYTCTIVDNTGCQLFVDEIVNSFSTNFEIGTLVIVDENCGDGTGSITLNPTGGTAPLVYSWDVPNPCCSYTLNCYDLNNNGWGGTPQPEVVVYINGSVYGNFTVPTGNGNSLFTTEIPVCTGDVIEFQYNEGQQNQNNTYEVLDSEGNIIFEDGPNPFNGVAFTTTAACIIESTNELSGLNAGDYYVTITDFYGCSLTDTFTVQNITGGFEISNAIVTDETCGLMNGAIDITIVGGSMPYTISWSNGEPTIDVADLAGGNYSVNIQDATGCEINGGYTVLSVGNPVVITNVVVTNATCATCSEGSIDQTLDVSGEPYIFSWDNGATTEDLSGLTPGTYTVTITNADGCDSIVTYTIDNTEGIFEIGNLEMHLFPNPSDGQFEIQFNNMNVGELHFTMFDEAGRVIWMNTEYINTTEGSIEFDLSSLSTGIYTLRAESNSGNWQRMVVIR